MAANQPAGQYQQQQPVVVEAIPVNYQPAYQPTTTTTYVVQQGAPILVEMSGSAYYGTTPKRVLCQFCGADVSTRTVREVGLCTHLSALGLCFIGCWPCAPLPYCMPETMDSVHICPNCGHVLGRKTVL